MYKHILVATDGSDLANKGLEQAIGLAKELSAKITILTVTDLFPSYGIVVAPGLSTSPEIFEEYRTSMAEQAKAIVQQAIGKARDAGVIVEGLHIENQSPAVGIVEAAETHQAELIVIASHGRRGVNKLLLGSQAAEVLSLSKVPVLVVK
ncbi:universal stress protein [Pseudochrobactrum asaccharolyticum]|uniref:Universal stress protein n=1 Tax=Pseudochrobactrum asaccharolyticum TaxID=354351 RepID=A0A366E6N2_9HYPH|nr:universal stress protein [Pseudochrobactrum asaccharolyticum]RBO97972.1 nucleotide-binding universal stress UspA family protein [Pseudochrobactrum asaccharolyticum]